MTIIVFLVDTSASMNQRTYMGTTLLDVTKGAVETFMKIRSRDPTSRGDRYMLLTYEDPPQNVKAGWKENHATFMKELKNLQSTGLSSLGPALKNTFDLLNVNRMTSGIDTYGQGRCPFYLEPAIIICITDGRKLTSSNGVQHELNLPMSNIVPGSELTKEPFRWDQRLFGLVLRMPATPMPENVPTYIPSADDSSIDVMCEVTGGRSYVVTTQRSLIMCIESLVQKCQSGVVINFEKIGADPNLEDGKNGDDKKKPLTPSANAWHNCRKLIYVPRSAQKGYSVGHWPIPEAFWPDIQSGTLPPRSAHPVIKFSCTSCDPMSLESLPFDKYELEPSPLTQYILGRRAPNVAWQVFVSNSAKYSDIGHPFGYMKASTNLNCVNLFVMPYNYPALLPLLDDLFRIHKLKPTMKWKQQFENYLKTMPVYYAQPLRRALQRMGVGNLVPDNLDTCLSYSVVSYLKKLKNQAKIEYDRLVQSVGQKTTQLEGLKVTARSQPSILQRKDFNQLLQHFGGNMSQLRQELTDFNTFTLAPRDREIKPQAYRNAFDISRKDVLSQIAKMKANFLLSAAGGMRLQDEEKMHNIPVQDMGNYQEHLKKMPQPLREIETAPRREHTFGNPFKVNKNLMIDEADEAMPGQQSSRKRGLSEAQSSPGPKRRKPGPLPKDVPARTLMSPSHDAVVENANDMDLNFPPDSDTLIISDPESPDAESDSGLENNHVIDLSEEDENEAVKPAGSPEPAGENHVNDRPPTTTPMVTSQAAREHNRSLKHSMVKEVRKPGKNYDRIFSQLNQVQGNLDTKCLFIKDIVKEASRFKKRILVEMLEQFEATLVKTEVNNKRKTPNNLHVNSNNLHKPPSR